MKLKNTFLIFVGENSNNYYGKTRKKINYLFLELEKDFPYKLLADISYDLH